MDNGFHTFGTGANFFISLTEPLAGLYSTGFAADPIKYGFMV